jgi:predicted metal-dependent phosphoesterase TrpH
VSRPQNLRLDLHLHTHASWDCLSNPQAILERAKEKGIHRVAMTDHNLLGLSLEMHQAHPEEVIPGEEVRTAEGMDLIGLYIKREIPKGTPAREACEMIREDGGIIYLPHPYAPGKGASGRFAEELAPLVDVVEVFNARLHPGRLNAPALALAESQEKLQGAGSDAHMVGEVGGGWVEVPYHENTPEGLLGALAEGRVGGKTSPNWVHIASTWAKLHKKLKLPLP